MYGHRNYQKESQFVFEAGLAKKEQKRFFYDDVYGEKSVNNEYNNFSYSTKQSFNSVFMPKLSAQTDIDEIKKHIDIQKYSKGQVVGHPKFGVGTILSITPDGKMADIDFGSLGKKTLMLDIAPLKILKK